MTWSLAPGDGLAYMATLPDASVSAIITDLPYGITNCAFDVIIPFAPMWEAVKRVLKPRGVFVTTASQPFTSALVMSNLEWFRCEWIWSKGTTTNYQLSKIHPLKEHESILVFSENTHSYNPQMIERKEPLDTRNWKKEIKRKMMRIRSDRREGKLHTQFFPRSILSVNAVAGECNGAYRVHPTQKPVALYAYLIRTYTNPGDTVLDFCAGSGTTGVACIKEGRDFLGCELLPEYYATAQRRLEDAAAQPMLIPVEVV